MDIELFILFLMTLSYFSVCLFLGIVAAISLWLFYRSGLKVQKLQEKIKQKQSKCEQLEEELTQLRITSEESSRLKSAFLANISHEIRTPLNAIVGFSDLLIDEDDPEAKQAYTDIIRANSEQLLKSIHDVLDLAKIEAGKLEFIDSVFDVNQLMTELEMTIRWRIKTKSIGLRTELPPVSCCIRSERNRLAQVLTNLLSNSIKFTTEGNVKFGYYPKGQKLHFFVDDTGCGIPADQLDLVFERFIKLNSFEQGSGLGLPICYNIVHQLGGNIGVESKLGEGSHFWFNIPYIKA